MDFFRRREPDPDLDVHDAAAWWFTRLHSDNISHEELARFHAWLDRSVENAAAFAQIERMWLGADALASDPSVLAVRAAVLGERRPRSHFLVAAAAAVVLVVAGLAVSVTLPDRWFAEVAAAFGFPFTERSAFSTAIGERSTVTLADGSLLTLDTDSAATVLYDSKRRLIKLERGRAFFEVAKNRQAPFVVEAGGEIVTAVGTVFDIRLGEAEVRVTLVEGNVVVDEAPEPGGASNPPARRFAATLQPGEQLLARMGQPTVVSRANIDQAISWRDGRLIFLDQTLSDAVAEINRYTRTPIVLGDERIGGLSINGVFLSGQPAEFAQSLTDIYPVKVELSDPRAIRVSWRSPS